MLKVKRSPESAFWMHEENIMRIVSLLPTATEIIFQLGLGKQLVGVSHECNFPREARRIPKVNSTDINYINATSKEIDSHVEQKMHEQKSLYVINKNLLLKLNPTHLITQQLCNVCAITPSDVQKIIMDLPSQPEMISLNPKSLSEICTEILRMGVLLNKKKEAEKLVKKLQIKIVQIRQKTKNLNKKSVFCVEWIDPLFACGHWVPEMVEIAGGKDVLGYQNKPSRKVDWEQVVKHNPEILIFMPCGFSFEKAKREMKILYEMPFWEKLKAVQNNQVWLVDGPGYFNQSGPRVIAKGIEILGKIIHPGVFGKTTKKEAILLN